MPQLTTRALEEWCLEALSDSIEDGSDSDTDLSMLTVVVPSLERQPYLMRQIRFWASKTARLVIVDGSGRPLDGRICTAIGEHPRITYVNQRSSWADRLNLASRHIETPYTVMLGDDEFHLPTGLSASLAVLEESSDLVGCMGQVLSASPIRSSRRISFSRAYPALAGYSVRNTEPEERLVAAMSAYNMATCYAVLRTQAWRRSWGAVGNWRIPIAAEIQQALAVYLLGGLATTNQVQWLRSAENPPIVLEEEGNHRVLFPEWWNSPRDETERSQFVASVSEAVAGELGIGHDQISVSVSTAIGAFVDSQPSLTNESVTRGSVRSGLLDLASRTKRTIARLLPTPLLLSAKRVFGVASRALGGPGGGYYGTVEDLPKIPSAEGLVFTPGAVDELVAIEAMVAEFHDLLSRDED